MIWIIYDYIYTCIAKQIGINRYGLVIFQSWASPNSSILQFLVTDDAKEFWIHVFVGGFSSDEGPKPHLVSKCIGPGYLLHSHGGSMAHRNRWFTKLRNAGSFHGEPLVITRWYRPTKI
jgi:hypothetical protein